MSQILIEGLTAAYIDNLGLPDVAFEVNPSLSTAENDYNPNRTCSVVDSNGNIYFAYSFTVYYIYIDNGRNWCWDRFVKVFKSQNNGASWIDLNFPLDITHRSTGEEVTLFIDDDDNLHLACAGSYECASIDDKAQNEGVTYAFYNGSWTVESVAINTSWPCPDLIVYNDDIYFFYENYDDGKISYKIKSNGTWSTENFVPNSAFWINNFSLCLHIDKICASGWDYDNADGYWYNEYDLNTSTWGTAIKLYYDESTVMKMYSDGTNLIFVINDKILMKTTGAFSETDLAFSDYYPRSVDIFKDINGNNHICYNGDSTALCYKYEGSWSLNQTIVLSDYVSLENGYESSYDYIYFNGYIQSNYTAFVLNNNNPFTETTDVINIYYIASSTSTIGKHTCKIKILEYQSTVTAEAGTNVNEIFSTNHGLATNDFIVNVTRSRTSRRVTKITDTILQTVSVPSQTSGDSIRLYKFVDRTDHVKAKSLSFTQKGQGQNEASFTLIDLSVSAGQYVQIFLDDILYFTGVLSDFRKPIRGLDKEFTEVHCIGLNNIPSRRTIQLNYAAATNCDEITQDMIDNYLVTEGIEYGTIDQGATLAEEWKEQAISISDVLDGAAEKSGYQWFIGKDFKLHFYQDPTSIASHAIIDGNGFTDYRDFEISETIDNYINKGFVIGGNDANGNPIFLQQQNTTQIQAQQDICAGSGVHGNIHSDSSIAEYQYITAAASTDATHIYKGAHPFVTGDFFWNVTRQAYGLITDGSSDPDMATCDNLSLDGTGISGQTSGDTIEAYLFPNDILRNILKRQSKIPRTISFSTFQIDFFPQEKLNINSTILGISDSWYNIEEVTTEDMGAGYFKSKIRAVLRDNTNFSTQNVPGASDFFRGF